MPCNRVITALGLGLGLILSSTGCRTYRDQAASMRLHWVNGQHTEAAREFDTRAHREKSSKDAVIWHLEAGAALRAVGSFPDSNAHFDEAAARIDDYERKASVRLAGETGAILSNPQNLPYEGRSSDKIMLHTYKALNYLALGKPEKSRPELIRAYQRQQDAVAENARRIEQTREAAAAGEHSVPVQRTLSNPALADSLRGITNNHDGFRAYADYVNPFAVYLDALYFLHAGEGPSDLERARTSLGRVIEVAGSNRYLQADLASLAAPSAGADRPPDGTITYVIFETGMAPSRNQVRLDIPILFADVSYVGVAFPTLEFHGDYLDHLTVTVGNHQWDTELVASMDSIVSLEFRNEWPAMVTKAVISAVTKAAASTAVNTAARKQSDWGGFLARIGTAIYQAAINIADTRSWTTLPKQFQVARLDTPEDRSLVLTTSTGHRQEVSLVEGRVNMVYVRCVSSTGPLLTSQFLLR